MFGTPMFQLCNIYPVSFKHLVRENNLVAGLDHFGNVYLLIAVPINTRLEQSRPNSEHEVVSISNMVELENLVDEGL